MSFTAAFGQRPGCVPLDPGPRRWEPELLLDRLRPSRLLSGTVLLGLLGAVLVAAMAVGAGGILVNDPLIDGGPLSWIRYGHGRDLATGGLYLGVGLLIWAWVRLGRDVLSGRAGTPQVRTAMVAWTAPLLLSPPLFTRDVYSYLAQGALALRGLDPYQFGPVKLPPGPIPDNVHYVWQTTPSPYGPLFILIAKTMSWLSGDDVILGVLLMRLVLLSGLVLLAVTLPQLAEHLGGTPTVAQWLVLANPLTLILLVGGPHNDLLMIGLLTAGTVLMLRRRHIAGAALVTAAVAVKAVAGIVLVFLVWVWVSRLPGSRGVRLLRAGGGSAAVLAAEFSALNWLAGVGFGWIPALTTPSLIVNWLSLPTAIGELSYTVATVFGQFSSHPFITTCRLLGAITFLVILIRQWWLARTGGPLAVRRAALVLLWAALLAPATLPWYFSWALALAAALPWAAHRLAWVVSGCTWLVLCTYPTGESAFTSWPYQLAVAAVAMLAGTALLRPDPLRLHGRPWLTPRAPSEQA